MKLDEVIGLIWLVKTMSSDIADMTKETGEAVDALRPHVASILVQLGDLLSELEPQVSRLIDHIDDRAAVRFKRLIDSGFTREESLILILNTRFSLEESIRRFNAKN